MKVSCLARYTAAAFIGSLLLFLVQPMLGRTMLPMFGGSAAVWGVCLAAYQVLLLGGYLYAHFMSRQKLAVQCSTHLPGLAAAAVWVAAFAFFRHRLAGWISADASAPWLKAGLCVPFFIGIPYLLLSAGSTLVQTWAARRHTGVYRLYAWSNAGSFIGLLAYPLVFEPFLGLTAQWLIFAGGILVYAALLFLLGRSELRSTALSAASEPPPEPLQPKAEVWTWYALPAVTAFALNAVVAHLFMDVTPLPMVWAIALAAFLLSYSLGFSDFRLVRRRTAGAGGGGVRQRPVGHGKLLAKRVRRAGGAGAVRNGAARMAVRGTPGTGPTHPLLSGNRGGRCGGRFTGVFRGPAGVQAGYGVPAGFGGMLPADRDAAF